MKTSEIFEEAKARIKSGKSTYICYAISETNYPYLCRKNVIDIISDRIAVDGILTLNYWLLRNGVKDDELTPVAMRNHRLAWLDILIEEFKSKGD